MSYHNHHTHHIKAQPKIVWACAWCAPSTYTPLRRGQEYTHGICNDHKQQLVRKTRKLFAQRNLN
ncbi:MAG: hypothetical protein ACR2LN_02865 [Candidatus Levyibacteriota bacterium]